MDFARHYRILAARARHSMTRTADPELKAHYRATALHYERKAEEADHREAAKTKRVHEHFDA